MSWQTVQYWWQSLYQDGLYELVRSYQHIPLQTQRRFIHPSQRNSAGNSSFQNGPWHTKCIYVQEAGRGGWENMLSNAILHYGRNDIAANSHATDEVKWYCENMNECRRALLMLMRQLTDEAVDLPSYRHLCCDICACVCMCQDCYQDVKTLTVDNDTYILSVSGTSNASSAPESIQRILKEQLMVYQTHLS